MATTRRAAGLGLIGYGLGTAVAFIAIGSPGGNYSNTTVANYISHGHWPAAAALAYLGAFASLGLLVFAEQMRHELGSAGHALWSLAVAGTTTAVAGWFLVGGVAVAFAEGGSHLAAVPHPVVYLVTEISNLVAVCASAFFVGSAALVLAAKATLPASLRVASYVAGVCGLLAAFFFTIFLFWLWTIIFGIWFARSDRATEPATAQPQAA